MSEIKLPEKLYYKIGEVAELTGLKPHVLRYWESEFRLFRPGKSRTKQRLYRQKDIEIVLQLKDLLHNQGYTIAGARKKLAEQRPFVDGSSDESEEQCHRATLLELRSDLLRLRALLDRSS